MIRSCWSHRRSGKESQEERHGVAGGAPWSHKRSPVETQKELPEVTNLSQPTFHYFNHQYIEISIVTDISGRQLEHFKTNFQLGWSLPLSLVTLQPSKLLQIDHSISSQYFLTNPKSKSNWPASQPGKFQRSKIQAKYKLLVYMRRL